MRVLDNLEPAKVFYFFEEICNIPHGSGNLDGISSYLERFARDRGLDVTRDGVNNIIMISPATAGYEDVDPIIMQGHMDMVAVKEPDCDLDMEREPLRLAVDGDCIYAKQTSLGGDDGIAVAYILAILDDETIAHPRIEAVITTDEEVGMEGATAIDLSGLQATRMLNIDSEEEGILLTSCAGGARVDCEIPVARETRQGSFYEIKVCGLSGGHSGTEIQKGHANAIKLLGRTLHMILDTVNVQIVRMEGGEKDNAIPVSASAVVYVPDGMGQTLADEAARIDTIIRNENLSKDKDVCILCSKAEMTEAQALTGACTRTVVDYLELLPNGVMAMSADIAGLVETSLNAGILQLTDGTFCCTSSVRSSVESSKADLIRMLDTAARMAGGTISVRGDYPGWQYRQDSRLRSDMVELYREMFGKEAQVEAIHAGLECGIMIAKRPELDCVSFGPDIYDIHTTKERLSISSTQRMWKYLLAILQKK